MMKAKKNVKRLLTLSLAALVLLASMAGCSSNAPTSSTTAASSQSQDSSAAQSEEKADPFGKYDPPITVTSVRVSAPTTVNYTNGESESNNVWTKLYEEELGIKIDYKWIVDSSQWDAKVNTMIASSDLPDFFQATPVQFKQLYNADLLQDLTGTLDYASEYTNMVMYESGNAQVDSAKIDGKLMAIPFNGVPKESAPIMYFRSDWLKALNLEVPKTMQDLIKVCEAFAKQDPDGNGKNDTYGYALSQWLSDSTEFQALANGYHAYPYKWITDADNKIAYGSIQPEMKSVLLELQNMYKAGLIDPEFGTKNMEKISEDISAGKLGILTSAFSIPLAYLLPTVKNNPNADWVSAPIVSNDSEPAKVVNDLGVIAYWVVNKNMEHPEVVMKMLNEFTKVFYENSDKATYDKYVNAEDGSEIWQNSLVRTYRGFKNLSGYQNINAVINGTKKETELTPEESGNYANIKKYMDNGDIDGWAWSKIYGVGGSMGVIETYQKEDRYIQNQYDGTPSDSMAKYQSTLDKMEIEAFTNIIKGADISTFDEFVTNWKASGGDKITEELNSK